jgi:hypothetical protein
VVDIGEQYGVTAVGVRLHDPALPVLVEAMGTEQGLLELSLRIRIQQPLDRRQHPVLNESIRLESPSGKQIVRMVEEWVRLGVEVRRAGKVSGPVSLPSASNLQSALVRARAALTGTLRETGTRKRGEAKRLLLEQVAAEYRQAIKDKHRDPRNVVAARLGYTPAHIGRLLVEARKATPPLLGPASPGRAGEVPATKPPAKRTTKRGKS